MSQQVHYIENYHRAPYIHSLLHRIKHKIPKTITPFNKRTLVLNQYDKRALSTRSKPLRPKKKKKRINQRTEMK